MIMRNVSKVINNKRVIIKKPELLAPAGDLEKLKIAFKYGADACFIGGKEFSLRARASNFDIEDIRQAVDLANSLNKKVYVTTNILSHNENLEGLEEYLISLESVGVHAIICADPHVINTAKKVAPKLELHLSTQQSTTNHEAINFWLDEGVTRVVVARELYKNDIKEICENTKASVEVFIHGGMCSSYSGKCTLSNNMTDRDANRGGCAHSCRWNYTLYYKDNDDLKVISDKNVPYSMSSKDLMAMRHIPDLIEYGVDSLKIEGRMKSIHYIATVVSAYRRLIDDYSNNPDEFVFTDKYIKSIKKAENRLTAEGFFNGVPTVNEQLYNMRSEKPTQEFVGIVLDYDSKTNIATVQQRNYFSAENIFEVLRFDGTTENFKINEIYDENHNVLDAARHPKQIVYFNTYVQLEKDNLIRIIKSSK